MTTRNAILTEVCTFLDFSRPSHEITTKAVKPASSPKHRGQSTLTPSASKLENSQQQFAENTKKTAIPDGAFSSTVMPWPARWTLSGRTGEFL